MANTTPGPDRRVDTRTSASSAASCRWCEGAIRGRRRNGFCSDRCRMRARRTERAARVQALLAEIDEAVAELRRELRHGGHVPGGAGAVGWRAVKSCGNSTKGAVR